MIEIDERKRRRYFCTFELTRRVIPTLRIHKKKKKKLKIHVRIQKNSSVQMKAIQARYKINLPEGFVCQ
ncbi:MAG: hypothetical protein ACI90V_002414 [Bacillariaceae sp.]|jgi:hypothetical protein